MTEGPAGATLYLVCGKLAAGKSTLTRDLAALPRTVLISEDDWLIDLYPDENVTIADYVRHSGRIRKAMGPHVVALLQVGVSVVLDFPANTAAIRRWMRALFEAAGCGHQLHYLDVPEDVCRSRLRLRNREGAHPYSVTDEQFDAITEHFTPPDTAERFNMIVHAHRVDADETLSSN